MPTIDPQATPTVIYETYGLPCFTLNSGNSSTDMVRSQFDYSIRQRRAVSGYDTFTVRLIMPYWQQKNFEQFWLDLNNGNDKFYTDQPVNSDTTKNKIVRFTSGYNITQRGNTTFEVVIPIELIQTGIDSDTTCPRTPERTLVIREGLVPC